MTRKLDQEPLACGLLVKMLYLDLGLGSSQIAIREEARNLIFLHNALKLMF